MHAFQGYFFRLLAAFLLTVTTLEVSRPQVPPADTPAVDPVLAYTAFLGGRDRTGTPISVAVDAGGNFYVAGTIRNANFPTVNALQSEYTPGECRQSVKLPILEPCPDIFIAKLNSSGTALVYSTYLGGADIDTVSDIAVDARGYAYIVGYTSSENFPITVNRQPGTPPIPGSFVMKLSPDGSRIIYSTRLVNGAVGARAIAVDGSGSAYVTGLATPTFPRINGLPFEIGGVLMFKSTDGGEAWRVSNRGLQGPLRSTVAAAVTPQGSSVIYTAAFDKLFKSEDQGANWQRVDFGPLSLDFFQAIAVEPENASTIYLATRGTMIKSIDGGASWREINNGLPEGDRDVTAVAISPSEPSTVYIGTSRIYKSIDGGGRWRPTALTSLAPILRVEGLQVDPANSSVVYASVTESAGRFKPRLFKTQDAGTAWRPIEQGLEQALLPNTWGPIPLAIDPTMPSTLYSGTRVGVFKSVDAGEFWTPANSGIEDDRGLTAPVGILTMDPANPPHSTPVQGSSYSKRLTEPQAGAWSKGSFPLISRT